MPIGELSRMGPRVVIGRHCVLGARCILHPGVVIGADGFGFAPHAGAWVKIEQLGAVRIGDDVEIGANTCIDRGALDDTVIGDGVKLDNLIQIGHNVQVGEHSAMAGCVGVAGSAHIGAHCTVGWRGHRAGPPEPGRRRAHLGRFRGHPLDSPARPIHRRFSHRRQCRLGKKRRLAQAAQPPARAAQGRRTGARSRSDFIQTAMMDIHQILKQLPAPLPLSAG
jgi:hypothetical protein